MVSVLCDGIYGRSPGGRYDQNKGCKSRKICYDPKEDIAALISMSRFCGISKKTPASYDKSHKIIEKTYFKIFNKKEGLIN